MEHTTASPPADPRRTQADGDMDERDIPEIRSLITPGLVSVPPLPEWLRRFFRRTHAHR